MGVVIFTLFALCCAAAGAVPAALNNARIIGGTVTTINQYPVMASLLLTRDFVHWRHNCGGSILNQRSILSAAHCLYRRQPNVYRARLGSSFASSGGVIFNFAQFIMHPNYNSRNQDNDVAIMRTSSGISYNNVIQPARIAGANYNLRDNERVWAAGWGVTSVNSNQHSEQLRHVQVYTINQAVCRQRYAARSPITDNMLCSGVLDVGGRDQCQMDSGGPLLHNGIVVGVCSFGHRCAEPRYPGVNARVSRFATWIGNNS
ncbi:trypsin, alkaline C-like [Manduca sexta]|uniref:trypsin n=1 Tax=Manduca sexta TaxID=7130 RepID=A0A921ZI20_MANSE|nr:trypsin, alkaline C-like [Manduca sexta]KAG6458161.1 hypothetical protein O3G_MSEX010708 [Manduca sexta]KAG6458162.1 hypothetical protein O3G_MSEX010708 [Manduca sexta]